MALIEHPENQRHATLKTSMYNGVAHILTFVCPSGETATHLTQSLALGKIMLAAWGGPAAGDPEEPRVQKVEYGKFEAGKQTLIATFVEVTPRA